MDFVRSLRGGLSSLILKSLPDEGPTLLEALQMLAFVISRVVMPQSPEDLQPAFAQTTQRAGVGMAGTTLGSIVGLSPRATPTALVNPQMDRVAQDSITGPTDVRFAQLARLVAHGTGPGQAQQTIGLRKDLAVGPDLAQQPRPQLLLGAGQRTKDGVIGMSLKGLGDSTPIFIDLVLQALEHCRQAQRQEAFGADRRRTGIELLSVRPGLQTLGRRLGAPQSVDMQEFLTAALTCLDQGGGRREGLHEGPGKGFGPVVEAFQGQRVVLRQGGLELVDQSV